MSFSQILLFPFMLVLLLVRTCNQALAPSPVRVESSAACVGEWQMLHHDTCPEPGYREGKRMVLHADGSLECYGLLRRDIGWVYDESAATPVQQKGTWRLYDGGADGEQVLEFRFADDYGACGYFYRKDGYWDGERELWFYVSDPDHLQWARFVRPSELLKE